MIPLAVELAGELKYTGRTEFDAKTTALTQFRIDKYAPSGFFPFLCFGHDLSPAFPVNPDTVRKCYSGGIATLQLYL